MPDLAIRIYPHVVNIVFVFLGWGTGIIVNYLADLLPIIWGHFNRMKIENGSPIDFIDYAFCWRQITKLDKSHSVRICAVNVLYVSASLWLWNNRLPPIDYALFLLLLFFLGLVFIIDMEHRLIFHKLIILGYILGLIIGIKLNGLISTLVGGLFGFIFVLIIFLLGGLVMKQVARLREVTINKDALGFGDVLLSCILGLILGWPTILSGLLLAAILAGITSSVILMIKLINKEYHPNLTMPYGPFLVTSAIALILTG
jgi:leader peptidase (prepilin peptidase)/N-methyltransferase